MELLFGLIGLVLGIVVTMFVKSKPEEEISPMDLYAVEVPWDEKDPTFLSVKAGGSSIGTILRDPAVSERILASYIGYGIVYVRLVHGTPAYYYSNAREMELRRSIYLKNKKDQEPKS